MSTEKEGTDWSDADVKKLKDLASKNTCTPCIADKLERTESVIRNKVDVEDISLKLNDGKDCVKC